ncbi:MAG: GldG family protein [Deltaproteobacteria bacterium]|nr:GldG family protein [Deltaproteobacteria bacterium]
MAKKKDKKQLRNIGLVLLLMGTGAWPVVPQYPGFGLLPTTLGLVFLIFYGPRALKSDLASLSRPAGKRKIRLILSYLALTVILLTAGRLTFLPVYNTGPQSRLTLDENTLKILAKLPEPVTMEAYLSPMGEIRLGHLLDLYQRASDKITLKKSHGPGRAENVGHNLQLALPDRVILRSGPYTEAVSPINEMTLKAAFYRLVSPSRIVYNLLGDGEKSVQDTGSLGLSHWSGSLERQKIFIRDYFWAPDTPLPTAAAALILAGPKSHLSEEKNSALINYLAQGGRLLVLQDPLAPGVDPEVFSQLGLTLAQGLLVDPETAWVGTDDFFPLSFDFPAHPLTMGLQQPVVWPLAGSIIAADNFPPTDGEADNPLAGHTWAVARSSPDSFLETDLNSITKRQSEFNPEKDPAGPQVLASATSLVSGGRLVLAADSDLAGNVFIISLGNLAFMDSLLYWLLGAEDDLPQTSGGSFFNITQNRARALFWVPVVVWPLLTVLIWTVYYKKRHRWA